MVALIPLTRGFEALVDDEDFDRVSAYRWQVSPAHSGRTAYAMTSVGNGRSRTTLRMHRLILGPACDGAQVDHVNRNGLDNRRCNIRVCSPFENAANRRTPKSNTSGYQGVYWRKDRGKWVSRIQVRKRTIVIGTFASREAAAAAYRAAALAHFGQFTPDFLTEAPLQVRQDIGSSVSDQPPAILHARGPVFRGSLEHGALRCGGQLLTTDGQAW